MFRSPSGIGSPTSPSPPTLFTLVSTAAPVPGLSAPAKRKLPSERPKSPPRMVNASTRAPMAFWRGIAWAVEIWAWARVASALKSTKTARRGARAHPAAERKPGTLTGRRDALARTGALAPIRVVPHMQLDCFHPADRDRVPCRNLLHSRVQAELERLRPTVRVLQREEAVTRVHDQHACIQRLASRPRIVTASIICRRDIHGQHLPDRCAHLISGIHVSPVAHSPTDLAGGQRRSMNAQQERPSVPIH